MLTERAPHRSEIRGVAPMLGEIDLQHISVVPRVGHLFPPPLYIGVNPNRDSLTPPQMRYRVSSTGQLNTEGGIEL